MVLALTGVGLPTPEDIWLMLAGFLTSQSGFLGTIGNPEDVPLWHYGATLAFCALSNMIGDAACWWLGKRYGLSIRSRIKFFQKLLPEKRLHRVERWFGKMGGATVFFGRLMAGVRFVVFFTAGVSKMKLRKFLLWDALGCCLSIPLWLWLGHLGQSVHGTEDYHLFREWAKESGLWVMLAGVILVGGFIVYVKFFRKKDLETIEEQAEADTRSSQRLQPVSADADASKP
ncbi:MAG: DedA family protein [Planctomycetes bacterium]|nr:DedA family protein [Planctomycetota bacterium]